ncbi:MAG: hypothetical protein QME79_11200 [Bacillota bacterium]|nr:hypothetical protein [Bacillota bacterium]
MNSTLTTLLAGLLAAEMAFLADRAFLSGLEERARTSPGGPAVRPGAVLVSVVPAVEEAAKNLAAMLSGADLFGTHVIFGLAEAGFEAAVGEWRGLVAGLFSLLGHALFGAATNAALASTGSPFLATGAGVGLHIAWNALALRWGRQG